MVRYIKATDLTAEQRQCLEEAIKLMPNAAGRRKLSARITPWLFRKDGRSAVGIPCG